MGIVGRSLVAMVSTVLGNVRFGAGEEEFGGVVVAVRTVLRL